MNKFTVVLYPETNEDKPVLYKVFFGNNYYVHKGKKLRESVDRFLDDVFRGMRGKKADERYSKVVDHCLKYPAINKPVVEIIYNGSPATVLKKEMSLYKSMKNDNLSLNRVDIEPYKPEWMIKETLQKRCDKDACIKVGFFTLANKLPVKFKFCPNCGRLNK